MILYFLFFFIFCDNVYVLIRVNMFNGMFFMFWFIFCLFFIIFFIYYIWILEEFVRDNDFEVFDVFVDGNCMFCFVED